MPPCRPSRLRCSIASRARVNGVAGATPTASRPASRPTSSTRAVSSRTVRTVPAGGRSTSGVAQGRDQAGLAQEPDGARRLEVEHDSAALGTIAQERHDTVVARLCLAHDAFVAADRERRHTSSVHRGATFPSTPFPPDRSRVCRTMPRPIARRVGVVSAGDEQLLGRDHVGAEPARAVRDLAVRGRDDHGPLARNGRHELQDLLVGSRPDGVKSTRTGWPFDGATPPACVPSNTTHTSARVLACRRTRRSSKRSRCSTSDGSSGHARLATL